MTDLETRKKILQEKAKATRKELSEIEDNIKEVDWEIMEETCGCEISCKNCRNSTLIVAGEYHNFCLADECVACVDKCKEFLPDTLVSKYLKKERIYEDKYNKLAYFFDEDDKKVLDDKNLDRVIKLWEAMK